jgi:hypothetical protein
MDNQIVVQVWKLEGNGPFIATARATISTDWGDITLDRLKVIRNEKKQPWVALPQLSYMKDGKMQYKNIVKLPLRLKKLIDEKILTELGIDSCQ